MYSKKPNLLKTQAIKNISSPERFYENIKITSASSWVLSLATLFFIISLLIWSMFYKINTIIEVGVFCKNHVAYCFISENNFEKIKNTKKIKINLNDQTYYPKQLNNSPIKINNSNLCYAMHLSKLKPGDWTFLIKFNAPNLSDGNFKATILTNSTLPISLILN